MLDSVRDAAAAIDVVEQPLACGAEGKDQDLVCEAPLSPTNAIARIAFIESR